MGSLALIRDAGVILEVITEWTNWGPCEICVDKKGTKISRGQCRLKRRLTDRVNIYLIINYQLIIYLDI